MGITIRELRKGDLADVRSIFSEFVSYHYQRDSIFEKIASADLIWGDYLYASHTQDENCQVLVAELDGHIVGYCLGRSEEKPPIYSDRIVGAVGNIAVKEEFKRRGIGAALFRAINEWFQERGVHHIEIEAASTNPQAVHFWKKMGGREFIKRMLIPVSTDRPE